MLYIGTVARRPRLTGFGRPLPSLGGGGRLVIRVLKGLMTLAGLLLVAAADSEPAPFVTATPDHDPSTYYIVRADHWTAADERGFGEFITAIGDTDCRTVDQCLHGAGNPFRASDPDGIYFRSDCADLPYVLRFYYAWKRGLPFAYVSEVEPRGHTRDIRYTARGNAVAERVTLPSGDPVSGYAIIDTLRGAV